MHLQRHVFGVNRMVCGALYPHAYGPKKKGHNNVPYHCDLARISLAADELSFVTPM